MKTGDIILTRTNTNFGRIVGEKTGSYWTHVNIARDENTINEFSLFSNGILDLEKYLNSSEVEDYDIITGVADLNDYMRINDTQRFACYESLWGLSKLLKKYTTHRDMENIKSRPNSYTCASLIAEPISEKYNLGIHSSQFIPQDFERFK